MDWSDTPEQAVFRQEVKALVGEHLPELYRRMRDEGIEEGYEGGWIADRVSDDAERKGAAEAWTDAVSDHGWFAPHWPEPSTAVPASRPWSSSSTTRSWRRPARRLSAAPG